MSRRDAARRARARRAEAWDAFFGLRALGMAGLVLAIALLFQPSTPIRGAMALVFALAALASGKRVSLLTTLLVSAGIVGANLLVPVGRVLARLGPLVVTEQALREGIDKALTFEGLVLLSKACIRPGLSLPGRLGAVVAAAFSYYERILEYRGKIRAASFLRDADELMLAVWDSGGPEAGLRPSATARARGPLGPALAAAASILALAALAYGFWR